MVYSYHPRKKRSKKSDGFRGFRVDTKKPQATLRIFDGVGLASGQGSDRLVVIDRGAGHFRVLEETLDASSMWRRIPHEKTPRPGPIRNLIETG